MVSIVPIEVLPLLAYIISIIKFLRGRPEYQPSEFSPGRCLLLENHVSGRTAVSCINHSDSELFSGDALYHCPLVWVTILYN